MPKAGVWIENGKRKDFACRLSFKGLGLEWCLVGHYHVCGIRVGKLSPGIPKVHADAGRTLQLFCYSLHYCNPTSDCKDYSDLPFIYDEGACHYLGKTELTWEESFKECRKINGDMINGSLAWMGNHGKLDRMFNWLRDLVITTQIYFLFSDFPIEIPLGTLQSTHLDRIISSFA